MPDPVPSSSTDHASFGAALSLRALPHTAALYRVARRLAHSDEEASAATVAAVERCAGQGGDSRAACFAALRLVLDAHPAGQDRPVAPAGALDAAIDAATAFEEPELERMMMSRLDASPDVDVALRQLPLPERFAVLLVDVEDCSYEEAAAALGVDAATLASRLLDGRVRLVASLVDFARRAATDAQMHRGAADAQMHGEAAVAQVHRPPAGEASRDRGLAPVTPAHPALLELQLALDRRLTAADRAGVNDHVAVCEVCRRRVQVLRWARVRLGGVGGAQALPAELRARVERALAGIPRRESRAAAASNRTAAPTRWRRWLARWRSGA